MVKKLDINFGNKTYYLLLSVFAVLIVSGFAYAWTASIDGTPSEFGHSLGEVDSYFDIIADIEGCIPVTAQGEIACEGASGDCVWRNNKCIPEFITSVTKIKPKIGIKVASDTPSNNEDIATKEYVDSVAAGGGGVAINKARCPVWTIESATIRKGQVSFPLDDDSIYDGFLSKQGLRVNPSRSFYYMDCVENSDGTIKFNNPYASSTSAVDAYEMQVGSLSGYDRFFLMESEKEDTNHISYENQGYIGTEAFYWLLSNLNG